MMKKNKRKKTKKTQQQQNNSYLTLLHQPRPKKGTDRPLQFDVKQCFPGQNTI